METCWAARYAIPEDFQRGWSAVGGLDPLDTEDEAQRAVDYENANSWEKDYFYVHVDRWVDPWGCYPAAEDVYIIARPGLCAFTGETRDEAIDLARRYAEYACGRKLYVFRAQVVGSCDNEGETADGCLRVMPLGEPEEVAEEVR